MIKLFLLLFTSLVLFSAVNASELSTAYLKTNKSIRATALGDAVAAYPIDTDAIYYNPAGLFTNGYAYANENHDYHNIKARVNHSQAFTIGKLGYSEERKYASDISLDIHSYGIGIYGKSTQWGIKYKDIDYSIDGIRDRGYSIDFGILSTISQKTTMGILLKDTFKENVPVPGSACIGIALGGFLRDMTLLAEMEYTRASDKTIYKFGAEYELMDSLVLRTGYNQDIYSFGGDLILPMGKIQYAVSSGRAATSETIHQLGLYLSN